MLRLGERGRDLDEGLVEEEAPARGVPPREQAEGGRLRHVATQVAGRHGQLVQAGRERTSHRIGVRRCPGGSWSAELIIDRHVPPAQNSTRSSSDSRNARSQGRWSVTSASVAREARRTSAVGDRLAVAPGPSALRTGASSPIDPEMRERRGTAWSAGGCTPAPGRSRRHGSRRSCLLWAGGLLAGCASVLGLVSPWAAGSQGPQAACFTWRAPGGVSGTTAWSQRVIARTFDDGPGPCTPQVLSVLRQHHVPATVHGRLPVRSFGHEKSAPLAVMFNPTCAR